MEVCQSWLKREFKKWKTNQKKIPRLKHRKSKDRNYKWKLRDTNSAIKQFLTHVTEDLQGKESEWGKNNNLKRQQL